jgi:hypothetical protein
MGPFSTDGEELAHAVKLLNEHGEDWLSSCLSNAKSESIPICLSRKTYESSTTSPHLRKSPMVMTSSPSYCSDMSRAAGASSPALTGLDSFDTPFWMSERAGCRSKAASVSSLGAPYCSCHPSRCWRTGSFGVRGRKTGSRTGSVDGSMCAGAVSV